MSWRKRGRAQEGAASALLGLGRVIKERRPNTARKQNRAGRWAASPEPWRYTGAKAHQPTRKQGRTGRRIFEAQPLSSQAAAPAD